MRNFTGIFQRGAEGAHEQGNGKLKTENLLSVQKKPTNLYRPANRVFFPVTPYSAVNGNLRKSTAIPCLGQYLHLFALLQGARKQEVTGVGSWKMKTRRRCKRTTIKPVQACKPSLLSHHAIQCCQWKFAQIHGCSRPGTEVELLQGAHEQEAKGTRS